MRFEKKLQNFKFFQQTKNKDDSQKKNVDFPKKSKTSIKGIPNVFPKGDSSRDVFGMVKWPF